MPPPTVVDSWLSHRRFGVIIDAGSSGSRLLIYSWRDPRTVPVQLDHLENALPKVEKGAKNEDWVTKVEPGVYLCWLPSGKILTSGNLPGISSFGDNPEGVAEYLAPLLQHARDYIPPSMEEETPLFLFATAGMRLLEPEQQGRVLKATCQFLKFHSRFRIDEPSKDGPCGSSIRIITGEEEGLFGWIAVNYLMDGFTGSSEDRTTYGFLDMGGASTRARRRSGRRRISFLFACACWADARFTTRSSSRPGSGMVPTKPENATWLKPSTSTKRHDPHLLMVTNMFRTHAFRRTWS
jgi:golgi apyrase